MRSFWPTLVLTAFVLDARAATMDPAISRTVGELFTALPLCFEKNRGQTDAGVLFLSRGAGHTLFLESTRATFASQGRPPLRVKIAGANHDGKVTGLEPLAGRVHYYHGSDPAHWRTDVPTFGKVRCEGVYDGIDLVYYGNKRELEFDFIVSPRADPSVIQLEFEGRDVRLEADHGDIIARFGDTEVRLRKPYLYQDVDGTRREVGGRFVRKGERCLAFQVDSYDSSRPLVIDPVIVYSTYLGGGSQEIAMGIDVDDEGSAYVAGYTDSVDFPPQSAADASLGGSRDAFVTRFNVNGNGLVFSTYLGGSTNDQARALALDPDGFAYVLGLTGSDDFPATPGAFQTNYHGAVDAFVAKLTSAGALVYATYLGGSGEENNVFAIGGIAVNAAGNAFVATYTSSTDFPDTPGAYDGSLSGPSDAVVAKLSDDGSSLVWATYLGGTLHDVAYGVALDSGDNVYVTGLTRSENFPTTVGAYDRVIGGGSCFISMIPCSDVFVTKFNANGASLAYSTFLGGNRDDYGYAIAVDDQDQAYVTGSINSTNFPVSVGAFQTTPGSLGDAFVTKFNASGSDIVYSSFLGGQSGLDEGYAITVDGHGAAFVAGTALSSLFPTTPDALRTNNLGGDSFVTKVNVSGTDLEYSTFLGGSSAEGSYGIALDGDNNIYVVGYTDSTNFPSSGGAYDTSRGGSRDGFVTKLSNIPSPPLASLSIAKTDSSDPIVQGVNLTYTLTVTNRGPDDATSVVIEDTLPAGVSFVSASNGCTHDNGVVTCNLGTLADDASITVQIVVTPLAESVLTNIAVVAANEDDSNPADNTAQQTTVVTGPVCPDLSGSWTKMTSKCKVKGTNVTCSIKGSLAIQNSGVNPSDPCVVRYYLSTDATFDDPGDTLLAESAVAALKTGKLKKGKLKAKLSPGVTVSNQFVIAVIDAANAVAECVETNNVTAFGPLP